MDAAGVDPSVVKIEERANRDRKVQRVIGPARGADRDRHAGDLDPIRTRQREGSRELDKPLIVVATQTIEVGVDIDFDGLGVTRAVGADFFISRVFGLASDVSDPG